MQSLCPTAGNLMLTNGGLSCLLDYMPPSHLLPPQQLCSVHYSLQHVAACSSIPPQDSTQSMHLILPSYLVCNPLHPACDCTATPSV